MVRDRVVLGLDPDHKLGKVVSRVGDDLFRLVFSLRGLQLALLPIKSLRLLSFVSLSLVVAD